MPKSVNHNIRSFVWRIHSTVMCVVAYCSSLNKKKKVVDKNVEKERAKNGPWSTSVEIFATCQTHHPLLFVDVYLQNIFGWKISRFYISFDLLIQKRRLLFSLSNTIERSIIIGPTLLSLFSISRQVSIILRRACRVLFFGRKPARYLDSLGSIN